MFSTDRQNHFRPRGPATLSAKRQQFANAVFVQAMKRIFFIDPLLHIRRHKPPRIIARQPIGHLRQIIGAKAQKLGIGRDFPSAQGRSRSFDHDSKRIAKATPTFDPHRGGSGINTRFDQFDFAAGRYQWNHDLR